MRVLRTIRVAKALETSIEKTLNTNPGNLIGVRSSVLYDPGMQLECGTVTVMSAIHIQT